MIGHLEVYAYATFTKVSLSHCVLSKKPITGVLEKSGSDVQEDEVILDKDVLSSQSGGNRERKSNNPWLTKPNALLH